MLFVRLRERFVTHLIGDYVLVLNLVRRPARWPMLVEAARVSARFTRP